MLPVPTQFLLDRSQYVVVESCLSKLLNMVSGMPQGSVFGPMLFVPPVYLGRTFFLH